jgi:hypothetical protein
MQYLIGLLILFCSANIFSATTLDFSGDAYVKGYFKNSTGPDGTSAFNQLIRLNFEAKPDEHLKIKTGLVLSSNSWEGDNHSSIANSGTAIGGTNDNTVGNSYVNHLDYGLIEYSKNGWITSLGRQKVTSPGSFLTSDDRRDRIQVLKFFSPTEVLAIVYDKRFEGKLNDSRDDLDMYSLNYYGSYNQFKYALQSGYWYSKKFNASGLTQPGIVNLNKVKQFTPQLSFEFQKINFDFYYTLLWGGADYYKSEHHSFAVKLTKEFDSFKGEYESTLTKHGGLVASGFDTLSSVINSNPDHNQSSIALKRIGLGSGNNSVNESLHMLRFTKLLMPELQITFGTGFAKIDQQKLVVLDTTLRYEINKNFSVQSKYGKFLKDNKDHAGSLGVFATF